MQLDPAVAKTRPSNFSPVVLRMLGFTSSDAGPCDGRVRSKSDVTNPIPSAQDGQELHSWESHTSIDHEPTDLKAK